MLYNYSKQSAKFFSERGVRAWGIDSVVVKKLGSWLEIELRWLKAPYAFGRSVNYKNPLVIAAFSAGEFYR